MVFSAALIVFRESLEAALFVGIVAAATRGVLGRGRWLGAGVGLGFLGAIVLALLAPLLADAFDGLGQDLVNIAVLTVALLMLLWHCVWGGTHAREMVGEARTLGQSVQQGQERPWALLIAVALAVLREGAETVLFVAGSMQGDANGAPMLAVLGSCATGLALGALTGWLVYAGLARIPTRHLFLATNVLVSLLAASIASQLARALSQAGWLEIGAEPVWDSSGTLAQDSPLGTLLHAMVGYDAQPTAAQLASYAAALLLIVAGSRWMARRTSRPERLQRPR
ncbi:FTR1 family iron permease [Leptothrix sp. BB-4]